MAEGYGGGGAYRLTPPQVKAYDPSSVEAFYAQRIGLPGIEYGSVAPYMQQARLDRLDAAEDYNTNLAAVNAQQYDLGLRRMASEREKEMIGLNKTALEHPNQAATFAYSSQLIRPGAAQHASNLAVAGLDKTRSEAFENYGQGANFFDMAGVRPPDGATYLPSGAPTSPMTQGESRDIRKEQVQGSYSLAAARAKGGGPVGGADMRALSDDLRSIEQQYTDYLGSMERSLIRGEMAHTDAAGNVTQGTQLSPEQRAELRARFTAQAQQRREQQRADLEHVWRQGGRGNLLPPRVGAGIAGGAPTDKPREAPLVVGGQSGDTGAATPTPPQAGPGAAREGLNGGSELTSGATRLSTRLREMGIPNAERIAATALSEKRRLNAAGYDTAADGTVRIYDKKGQVIATVPAR